MTTRILEDTEETEIDYKCTNSQVVVAHTLNLSTWKAETDRTPWVRGQSGLQNEFLKSQIYSETLSPNPNKSTNKNTESKTNTKKVQIILYDLQRFLPLSYDFGKIFIFSFEISSQSPLQALPPQRILLAVLGSERVVERVPSFSSSTNVLFHLMFGPTSKYTYFDSSVFREIWKLNMHTSFIRFQINWI